MTGEKRSAAAADEQHDIAAIVLDVEGTTTSISFVNDTLFPYCREFLKKHVDEKWETEEFKEIFAKLKEQAKEDGDKKVEGFVPIKEDSIEEAKETLIKNILWQMDNDRKAGALKQLQGHMWKAAHKPVLGHVYDDVPKAFEEWTNSGKKLYIYSSGSVEAQKLLFENSVHGNLLKFISGHFDTAVGAKQEANSYKSILKEINLEPSKVLFLTDIVKEAEAAKAAGLSTTIVIREGNAKLNDDDKAAFKTIESFADLSFASANKRQKIEESTEVEKNNDVPSEKESVTVETAIESMDTSDDTKVTDEKKVSETESEVKKVELKVESKVEKTVEETEKVEKKVEKEEETPMEEDTKHEKIVAKPKEEKSTDVKKTEEKSVISKEESKVEVPVETEKHEEKKLSKEPTEEGKTEEKIENSVPEKITETVTQKIVESVSEKVVEKVTENVVDNLTEEVKEEVTEVKKTKEETKAEDKIVQKNRDVEKTESKKLDEPPKDKADKGENKENVEKVEKPLDQDVEVAEEAEEVENENDLVGKGETEVKKLNGATNGDAIKEKEAHSNGVSEESKKNGDTTEECIKVKKTVPVDGAVEQDVVPPPVVVAASS